MTEQLDQPLDATASWTTPDPPVDDVPGDVAKGFSPPPPPPLTYGAPTGEAAPSTWLPTTSPHDTTASAPSTLPRPPVTPTSWPPTSPPPSSLTGLIAAALTRARMRRRRSRGVLVMVTVLVVVLFSVGFIFGLTGK